MASPLHRLVDAAAMWAEDRRRRAPAPFRPAAPAPLECFGPLPPLPLPPRRAGLWSAPSPRPSAGDGRMIVSVCPARGTPRGTAILVPPWKVPGLGALAGWTRLLAAAGQEVWTLVPPRHLQRAAPGVRSGEGFVSPDLGALRAALEQLVAEVRALAALARARGPTALVGLSLGALGAALAATGPEAVDLAALVAPPADVAAVLAGTAVGRRYAALAAGAGAPLPPADEVAALLAPLRPASRRPTARRVLVAAGSEDRIALLAPAIALARAWDADLRVYPRGHLTLLFACRAARAEVARALAKAEAGGAGASAAALAS